MKKKIITSVLSSLMVLGISNNTFASEINNQEYKISESVLDYTPDPNSPYRQKQTKELYANMKDPGKAMGLSALYFGLGQIYAGDTNRGALILGGGTVLTATVLLLILPNLNQRQESVSATGYALSLGALGLAYALNIRDAYTTAESVNNKINEKLLNSNSSLYHLEKLNISTNNSTVGLTYKVDF